MAVDLLRPRRCSPGDAGPDRHHRFVARRVRHPHRLAGRVADRSGDRRLGPRRGRGTRAGVGRPAGGGVSRRGRHPGWCVRNRGTPPPPPPARRPTVRPSRFRHRRGRDHVSVLRQLRLLLHRHAVHAAGHGLHPAADRVRAGAARPAGADSQCHRASLPSATRLAGQRLDRSAAVGRRLVPDAFSDRGRDVHRPGLAAAGHGLRNRHLHGADDGGDHGRRARREAGRRIGGQRRHP